MGWFEMIKIILIDIYMYIFAPQLINILMKNIKHLLFLSILCSLVLFTNCGDDDDDATVASFTGSIGDAYQGGIVYYLFQEGNTGYVAGEVHGLIAATEDQSTELGAYWGCSQTEIIGADGTAIGTGAQNTLDILAWCSEDGIAAKLSADYKVTENGVTYDDWFLPSKDELNKLYLNRDAIGGFEQHSGTAAVGGYYWSSTDYDNNGAWRQNFGNGNQFYRYSYNTVRVRSFRAF